jgi:hypothetical protein
VSAPDCHKVARAALCMTGSTPWPRDRSAAHFASTADAVTLRDALAALPFVARGTHRSDPLDWFDQGEAAAVLTAAVAVREAGK